MDTTAIVESLLALAQGKTAEADAAKQAADRLMRKYNLTKGVVFDKIVRRDVGEIQVQSRFRRAPRWSRSIARTVADIFHGQHVYNKSTKYTKLPMSYVKGLNGTGRPWFHHTTSVPVPPLDFDNFIMRHGDESYHAFELDDLQAALPLEFMALVSRKYHQVFVPRPGGGLYFVHLSAAHILKKTGIRVSSKPTLVAQCTPDGLAFFAKQPNRSYTFFSMKSELDIMASIFLQLESKLYDVATKEAVDSGCYGSEISMYRNSFIAASAESFGQIVSCNKDKQALVKRYIELTYPKLNKVPPSRATPVPEARVEGREATVPIEWPTDRLLPLVSLEQLAKRW